MRSSKIRNAKIKFVGQSNGRLTVLDVVLSGKREDLHLICQCDCGNQTKTRLDRFTKTKSCGCLNRWSNQDPNLAAFNAVYSSYKTSSKRRKLSFELSKEEFKFITQQKCAYCNLEPSNIKTSKRGQFIYNGIDRLDNKIGYIASNSVACCKKCNFFKNSMNHDTFLELVKTIANNSTVNTGIKEHKLAGYLARANAVAQNSHDSQTKVGAILIEKKSGAVRAEGYNGFVRGAPDDKLPNTRPEKYKYIIHAEMNLICNAVRGGISTSDSAIFCTLSPCVSCTRALYQSGIDTVYFKDKYSDLEESMSMPDLKVVIEPIGNFFRMTINSVRANT